jgi:dipeptidyl aminopeptidase/acylaminoacyl peptidase
MQPQDGDGELFVRNVSTGVEWRSPRGYRPPTPPPDPSDPEATAAFLALGRLLRPIFSADTRYLFFTIEPAKADLLKARKDKKKPEEMPKNALGIMDLASGKITRIDDVKSIQVPQDGTGYVAILKEAGREPRDPDKLPTATNSPNANAAASPSPTASPTPSPTPTPKPGSPKKEYGSTLILRRLSDGESRTFADVLDYSFAKDGKTLVFSVSSRKDENNGAFRFIPGLDGPPTPLLKGPGKYTKFTWDEKQTQLAFISDHDDAAAKQPRFKVYHWPRGSAAATEVVSPKTEGFRPDYVVSEKGSLAFSYDGSRLFISSAPTPDPEPDPANAIADEDKVNLDLWHWKDEYIQPTQKVRAIVDRDRSYRGVWHIADKKFVQLADPSLETINPGANGLYAIGSDDRPYRVQSNWDPGYTDFYLVNTLDGSRKPLIKAHQFGASWSPDGKYVIYFDGKDWNSVSVPDMKVTNLTARLKNAKFARDDVDTPSPAPSYGIAGWTKDDKSVLIYDHFDIWQVDPAGAGGTNLTAGTGSREKTEFRYVRLDPDERAIDPDKPMLLRAENEETRDSGFYRMKIGSQLERLIMEPKNIASPIKAKDADAVIFTASRFDTFPDLWATDMTFASPKRISDGDAQRAPFDWGSAELIRYKNKDGVPLQGIVFKPANFDPTKKYPMIVYLYEKLSDTVNNFVNPGPGQNVNPAVYTSNGYVVFMPDIVYKVGYPGKSALNCVLPGVHAVVDKGFVDKNNIGIQGHSWGGYQIAYMITQTKEFKAAAPGALVANMFSAYNGIRWGPGIPRQFQYEHSQSRIGGTPWDSTDKFKENSPLFYVQNVQTPVMMIANDQDDAVPWYQGIEFYLSLRRLGKEVYFFSYNGEYHGLRRRADQKDYARRMREFFDHFLKGEPAPDWMKNGIPYLKRDKEKEQYRQPAAVARD